MRLGEMLLRAGVVTELQLNAAIAEQNRWGGKLGQILVRMGTLTEDLLVLALCRQLQLPKAELAQLTAVPDALKERLDRATCERYRIVPIAYVHERKAVQLAMSDPFDVVALDDLTRMLGTKIEPFLAGDNAIGDAVRRLYNAASPTSLAGNVERLDIIDNSGHMRGSATNPNMRIAQPATPAQASFADRVDEQLRAVRAVADILAERGHIPRVFR